MADLLHFSDTSRNAQLAAHIAAIGASPKLQLRSGARAANVAATAAGILLLQMTLPSTWATTPSGGTASLVGTWSGTCSTAGLVGHYRLLDSAGTTCHEDGTVSQAGAMPTTASTASGSNIVTVASTSGFSAGLGLGIAGVGIVPGTIVVSLTSTTLTLDRATTGVASGEMIALGNVTGNLWLLNTNLTVGEAATVLYKRITAPGAG